MQAIFYVVNVLALLCHNVTVLVLIMLVVSVILNASSPNVSSHYFISDLAFLVDVLVFLLFTRSIVESAFFFLVEADLPRH